MKDQNNCGACYVFATVAAVESAILRKTTRRLDLSEQHVIDCSYKYNDELNDGCDGGDEIITLDYISKEGVLTEEEYPYVSGNSGKHEKCKKTKKATWGKGLTMIEIKTKDETKLAEAVATHGPLIVAISGLNTNLPFYSGGIYDQTSCGDEPNHVVLLVGYGTQRGRPYWLIKNSWGKSWGNKGYGKLLRGVNQCGIVSEEIWAVSV